MRRKLVLASTSPRRLDMLKEHGIRFKAMAPSSDEKKTEKKLKGTGHALIAQAIAYEKALSVLPVVRKGVILGSDTIVVLGGKILGKPRDLNEARRILGRLSGSTHRVITAMALIDTEKMKTVLAHDTTYVTFKRIGRAQINDYINNNRVLDKAGAYAVQEGADPFISRIDGSYNNVVGLPVEMLKKILKKF